jgi:hypothetical protein
MPLVTVTALTSTRRDHPSRVDCTFQGKDLKYPGKYYKDESHMSVPFITEYEALHFIFGDGRK